MVSKVDHIVATGRLDARIVQDGSADEVGTLVRSFNLMVERLQRSFTQQRQLLADTSHELRDPLTAVRAVQATTSSPAKPTITFAVAVEPPTLSVGDRLTITLSLENHSNQQIRGVRVFSAGPWEAYAIEQVMPAGSVDTSWLGATFSSSRTIGPGQSGHVRITASPRPAGGFHFTFTPNPLNDLHLPRLAGPSIVVAADVEVTQ